MQLLRGFDESADDTGGYVSIGNFDGVHRGHQQMIAALVAQAHAADVPAVVLTFDPHPITLLAPGRVPPRLSTLARKAELLAARGVDVLIAYPTDHQLLNLSPEAFFHEMIQAKLQARGLVEGPNFFFGKDRAGNVSTLQKLCDDAGMSLTVVDAVTEGHTLVSSSAIRAAIAEGRMADAVAMLGHAYRLTGTVRPGAGRGQSLGFPTANLADVETMLPSDGVYAGVVTLDGVAHPAAVHLGPNPTFAEQDRKLEVHILNYAGDLYGRTLSVDVSDRVRDTMHFADPSALQRQLTEDIAHVRHLSNLKTIRETT